MLSVSQNLKVVFLKRQQIKTDTLTLVTATDTTLTLVTATTTLEKFTVQN